MMVCMSLKRPSPEPKVPPEISPGAGPRTQGEAGTSTGINVAPGANDDGWDVQPEVPLADGSTVRLFKDGEALHAGFNAIKAARRFICLEVYTFADDATGRAFADLFCEKAQAGVKVYLICDAFGSFDIEGPMFQRMQRAGVHMRVFHPIRPWKLKHGWRPFNRDHRKILIVDDLVAGVGGLNVANPYAGSWVVQSAENAESPWRDTAIGVSGPIVRNFRLAFSRTWRYLGTGGPIRRAEYIHNLPAYGKRNTRPADTWPEVDSLGLLASVSAYQSPLIRYVSNVFLSAKKSIQLTMAYFAPTDEMIDALCDAASRGVRVQLMLPGKNDVPLLTVAARSFYETMMSHGIEIYERQGAILHAKTLVIDSVLTNVGSTNLDYRSVEYNCEVSAIIHSEGLGRQMSRLFEHDIRFAKRICPEEWRHRPIRDRIYQLCVKRARYLL